MDYDIRYFLKKLTKVFKLFLNLSHSTKKKLKVENFQIHNIICFFKIIFLNPKNSK